MRYKQMAETLLNELVESEGDGEREDMLDRRALKQAYRETKTQAGVYRIKNTITNG